MKIAKISIPDGILIRDINIKLLQLLKERPNIFYNDFIIDTVYGSPAQCIWAGGRCSFDESSNLLNEIQLYLQYDIQYKIIFSNLLITKDDLHDIQCNNYAKIIDSYHGFATVSTELLYSYLKQHYPNIKLCWSTGTDFGRDPIKQINELSKNDIVVLPIDYNKKLNNFTNYSNLEVITDCKCIDNCPCKRSHYKMISAYNLNLLPKVERECQLNLQCRIYNEFDPENLPYTFTSMIKRSEFKNYLSFGIDKFKLTDRYDATLTFASYLHYLIKKEYRAEFLQKFSLSEQTIKNINKFLIFLDS